MLVSADQWTGDVRLLPAGPWREPLRRGAARDARRRDAQGGERRRVERVHEQLGAVAPAMPRVSVRLVPGELVRADAIASETSLAVVACAA